MPQVWNKPAAVSVTRQSFGGMSPWPMLLRPKTMEAACNISDASVVITSSHLGDATELRRDATVAQRPSCPFCVPSVPLCIHRCLFVRLCLPSVTLGAPSVSPLCVPFLHPLTLPSCPQVRRSCGMMLVAVEYQGVAGTRKVASFMCCAAIYHLERSDIQ